MIEGQLVNLVSTVELHNAVLYVRWSLGTLISERVAAQVLAQANELCAGKPFPALVEMTGIKGMTRRAGELLSAEWQFEKTAIVGSSPVEEVIIAFYTARHSPAYPPRFFGSIKDAMAWLIEPQREPTT